MKNTALFFLLLLLFSCKKESSPNNGSSNSPATPTQSIIQDSSFIHVTINKVPMVVTAIQYNRESSTVSLMAANGLQKVEADCFNFWGTSGFNYQYQDTITYGFRKDTASEWEVIRAPYNTSDVLYDCCMLPTKDTLVKGTFSADFGAESNLLIEGIFRLYFK